MDREKIIQEIALAISILEGCDNGDIEKAKSFLRWMPDDSLQGIWEKHRLALEKKAPMSLKKSGI